jgi:two-component system, cell cycle response regulator
MTTGSTLHEAVMRWSNQLLACVSLQAFGDAIGHPPNVGEGAVTGNLVLLDSGHELRRLYSGDNARPVAPVPLTFVEALARVAPQYDALHAPWSGAFHASDHGLLFNGATAVTHVVMLPLPCERAIRGVYNLGGEGSLPPLATLEPIWLEHVTGQVAATLERLFHRARMLRTGVVDPVTGWNSREYMHARMREEVARGHRSGQPSTCLVVDVDAMQAINERHGISAGDHALREAASRVESQVRASDSWAHLGSDAFVILLPGTAPLEALALAERILATMRATPVVVAAGLELPLTVSIGMASSGMPGRDARKAAANLWLAEAESALHRAKRAGGNRWASAAMTREQ